MPFLILTYLCLLCHRNIQLEYFGISPYILKPYRACIKPCPKYQDLVEVFQQSLSENRVNVFGSRYDIFINTFRSSYSGEEPPG